MFLRDGASGRALIYFVKESRKMIGELRFLVFTRLPVVRCRWELEEIKLEPSQTFVYSPETWISAGKLDLIALDMFNVVCQTCVYPRIVVFSFLLCSIVWEISLEC